MKEEEIEKYKKAGEIAIKVHALAKEIIKDGAKTFDVAEKLENKIVQLGGKPAWPMNLSINSVAAHWTPKTNDETLFKKGDVVKVDVGVHVDGYIADTARTIEIGTTNWTELINASKEALNAAIDIAKPGVTISKIGEIVEDTIKSHGFVPIANLTGHGLAQWENHTPPSIPNFNNKSTQKLEEDTAIAIEPFATNGIGKVIDAKGSEIYKIENPRAVRQPIARKILNYAIKEHKELPFGKRELSKNIGAFGLEMGLRELKRVEAIYEFPVLKEESNGIVAQTEDTILLLDTPLITTKL